MNKIIKISSNQGGAFNNQNLVDFDIPQNSGVYDLSKSYIQLRARCNATATTPADDPTNSGVYMPIVRMNNDAGDRMEVKFKNAVMVKNASMNCANKGTVADVRRTDVLNALFQNYEMNAMERNSNSKQDLIQATDQHTTDSIFREIRKEGNIPSRNTEAPIKIPLKDLFGVGNVDNYSTDKYGKTRIHLELNRDRIRIDQILGVEDPAADPNSNWRRNNDDNLMSDNTTLRGADTKTLYWSVDAGDSHLEKSLFWVGQVLNVNATSVGGAGGGTDIANKKVRITSILYRRGAVGANQARLELTLNEAYGATLTAGQSYTAVRVDGVPATFDFSIDTAELILEKRGDGVTVPDKLNYFEFSTEEHNANGVKNFQRQFQIEPESVNVYLARNTNGLQVDKGDVSKWRLRLDNEDLTNRDVPVNSPLSRDRVQMCLTNSNRVLKSITERGQGSEANADSLINSYNKADNDCLMICNTVPQKPQEKLLQVNIDSNTASLGKMCLFKELIKVL